MYHSLAVAITSFLMKYMDDKTGSAAVITYGTELFLSAVVETVIVLVIGCLSGYLTETVLFLLFFCPIRKLAGGFHASTYFLCTFIFSVYYGMLCFFVPKAFGVPQGIILAVSCAVILWLAPVEDSNKPISREKAVQLRKKTKLVLAMEIAVLVLEECLCGIPDISAFLYYSFVSEGILLILGQIKNAMRKEENV